MSFATKGIGRRMRLGLGATLGATALALLLSVGAAADLSFCKPGSGAGQCDRPEGIAVDRSNGHVYVADPGNSRINVFDSAGGFLFAFGWGVADGTSAEPQTCTATCFKGIEGPGPGQLTTGRLALAIDNDPASPSYRDLYVAERDNVRVQKFSPDGEFVLMLGKGVNKTTGKNLCTAESGNVCGAGIPGRGAGEFNRLIYPGVGPNGTLYVVDSDNAGDKPSRVQKFEPSGVLLAEMLLPETGQSNAIAVDSSGDFYVSFVGENRLRKYDPSGNLIEALTVENSGSLSTDLSDNLFVFGSDGGKRVLTEYGSGGILHRFGYDSIANLANLEGIAVSSVLGGVYGTEPGANRVRLFSFPPSGPIACCLQAVAGNTKATIKGGVNPEGKATIYRFDYLNDEAFKTGGFSNPATKSTTETPVGSDFNLHDAEAEIGCGEPEVPPQPSCLDPETLYHYRLVATNEDGKSEAEGTFTTKPPLEITETYATEVGTDSAQLHATVNPLGIPAFGYFEYATEAAYLADLAEGEGHDGFAGASKAPNVDAGQAPISFGAGEAPTSRSAGIFGLEPGTTYRYRLIAEDPFMEVPGPVHSITTFPAPSPPAKACPNAVFRSGPSALLPNCRAYEMVSPVDKNGGEIRVLGSTLNYPARLEVSAADGNRLAYSSITAFGDSPSAPWTSEYIATRKEGEGWSTHSINPARQSSSLTITPSFKYDVQYKAFSPDLSSGWLIHDTEPPLDECAPAGNLNLYRRDNATDTYEALTIAEPTDIGSGGYELELQGVSGDEARAVIRANGKLTPEASTKGLNQLYMHVADPEGGCGELRLVSVLPNGKAESNADASVGTFTPSALSGETRINSVSHAISTDGSLVFWSTKIALYLRDLELGKTVLVASSGSFWNATPDGSKALYSVGTELFELDADKALAGEAGTSTPIAEGFKGVVANSEDLSRVYFVSTKELGGEGEEGKPNLYLHDAGGATSLIATLFGGSAALFDGDLSVRSPHYGFAVAQLSQIANGVRVTADGSHLAFVSAESLTGYDNRDAADGEPDLEVYLYDTGSDHLACISCNPTGARPAGRRFASENSQETRRISAHMAPAANQFFAPRTLSSDGNRLFFESFEALLARDTNGRGDVYEWQRAESQEECDEQGAELYVESAGGCLSLISTGQSPVDSEFADASPDGHDVFIRTSSSLSPQDPGQVDLYDARVNGGLPQPPGPPAACEGEACQGPLAAPNDPTPASSAFEGAGNVSEAPAKKKARKHKQHKKKHKAKQHKQTRHARHGKAKG